MASMAMSSMGCSLRQAAAPAGSQGAYFINARPAAPSSHAARMFSRPNQVVLYRNPIKTHGADRSCPKVLFDGASVLKMTGDAGTLRHSAPSRRRRDGNVRDRRLL